MTSSADNHDATLLLAAANDTEYYELRRALERGAGALLFGDSGAFHECGRRAEEGYYVQKMGPCCAAPEVSGDCCRKGAHRAARQNEARQARPAAASGDWVKVRAAQYRAARAARAKEGAK